jgi:hypothetical protein
MMPLATHAVGSRRGFLLGHTLSGTRHPVRFNLREGSDDDRNAAILAIGALGSGKTTLDQKLAYEAFLLGARVIDCDPKGDHRMHELPDVAPHVETIALRGERALRGMLDPLRIAHEHLRQDAAVGLSVWFRDHADHHMTILLDADGPFKGCDGRHSDRPVDELPHDPPPDGMFEPDELTDASVPNGRASAQAAARNAGRPREHTIRHSR